MSYPTCMQASLARVRRTRKQRQGQTFAEMDLATKTALLERFHPDFNMAVKRPLTMGVNTGDLAPQELVACLEAPSRTPSVSICRASIIAPTF